MFFSVAFLGSGKSPVVSFLTTFLASDPETLTTEIPDMPGPDDKAYIVIFRLYI